MQQDTTQQPNINQQFQDWLQQQQQGSQQNVQQAQQSTTPAPFKSPLPTQAGPSSVPNVYQNQIQQQQQQKAGVISPLQGGNTNSANSGQNQGTLPMIEKPYSQALKSLIDMRAAGMNVDHIIAQMEQARKQHLAKTGQQPGAQQSPTPTPTPNPVTQQNWPNFNMQNVGQAASTDWNSFVNTAKQMAQKAGLPPQVILAQAALESARGKAAPGNNFFGIKGTGTAGSNNMATKEADKNGNYYSENDNFAGYKTAADAIQAYINLIQNQYGINTKTQTPDAIIKQIKAHGYATSPTYVQDVENTPEFKGGGQ